MKRALFVLLSGLSLLLAPGARAAEMKVPPQQIVITSGGSDPTKVPLAGGTMTGTLTMDAPAQVVVGTSTTGDFYPSSGAFIVQGSNAQGMIGTFAGRPGSLGNFILIISSRPGGGVIGSVGLVISSGSNAQVQQLASFLYDSANGDVVMGGTEAHGEVFLSNNGTVNLVAEGSGGIFIEAPAAGAVDVTSQLGNVTISAQGGAGSDLTLEVGAGGFLNLAIPDVSTGQALCINASGQLSACTSGVGGGGACTCP